MYFKARHLNGWGDTGTVKLSVDWVDEDCSASIVIVVGIDSFKYIGHCGYRLQCNVLRLRCL